MRKSFFACALASFLLSFSTICPAGQAKKPAAPASKTATAPAPAAPAGPKKVRFKPGEILSAEMSLKPLSIANRSKFDVASHKKPVYAMVFFKPDKGRSLGIYDFTLVGPSGEFPCVAVREGDAALDAAKWEIEECDPAKIYSMCFIVDIPTLTKEQELKYTLRHKLLPGLVPDLNLEFRNMYDAPIAASTSIPPEGNVGVKPPQPAPPPKPAPAPAKPATPAAAPAKK